MRIAADSVHEASKPDAVALLQGWLDGRLVLSEAAVRAVLAENERLQDELDRANHSAKRCTAIHDHALYGPRRCELPVHGSSDHFTGLPGGWVKWAQADAAPQLPDTELHALRAHPAYEYATTQGPRKAFDLIDEPPEGDGWERNVDAGRPGEGWERFDYHEESYWRRLRASIPTQPACGEGIGHV